MPEPIWRKVDTSKQGKVWQEAVNFARYMHGAGSWTEKHEQAAEAYCAKNG